MTDSSPFAVTQPAADADERTALTGFLQRQRDLVAWKLRDAPDGVLQSVRTPTGLNLPGLVRHLTNVERSWLRDVFAGEQGLRYDWTDEDPDAEWRVPPTQTMAQLLSQYAAEAGRCDNVIAAAGSLDDRAARGEVSLRWILLHLVEETARHVGHADILREQADGSTGEDPDDS